MDEHEYAPAPVQPRVRPQLLPSGERDGPGVQAGLDQRADRQARPAPHGRQVLRVRRGQVLAAPGGGTLVPPLRQALSGLWDVARDREKRLELFGGNLASELLYAISLGATCLAYGVHLSLGQLVFVNTAASVLSSLIPVPGGIGAAEASLSAGLIAVGVDQSTAFAIAITQRLCTFYLPPIWGYVSLRWLTRKGYV